MRDILRIGIAQTTSDCRRRTNIATLNRLGQAASDSGCDLLALPEVSGLMAKNGKETLDEAHAESDDPYIAAAQECAQSRGIWVHIGSTPVRGSARLLNLSVLIDSHGAVRCRYAKIHLFDHMPAGRGPFRESDRYEAGSEAAAVDTPWGLWGMSVCYDLRFPQLFRDLSQLGARLIFVPSAFTEATGRAHWRPMLRSRAIENGCWIAAPAQAGLHANGRRTFGHSILVSPWGRIAADLGGDGTGFAAQTLNLGEAGAARRQIASLRQGRPYSIRVYNCET